MNPQVLIVMGSDSDYSVLQETEQLLKKFDIPFETHIASAHRAPHKVAALSEQAAARGIRVIIAAAGLAAHLPGVVAAGTVLPVIGVPMGGGPLNGVDALYSIVQMPAGTPVATMAIGKSGARNAALLAAQMLALADPALTEKLLAHRREMALEVEEKDQQLQQSR
jgi:5-(carboxyamino)imidazole ribonucleotide mutase